MPIRFQIIGLLSVALISPIATVAQQAPPPSTLPSSEPPNAFASLSRNAEFFAKEGSGIIRFQSVSEALLDNHKESYKGVLYFRRNRDELSVRCFVLMQDRRGSDWRPVRESVLSKGVYSDRDYLRKEEHTEKLTPRVPAPTLQELTPLAFSPLAGSPIRSILNFFDIATAERAEANTTRIELTKQPGALSNIERITLEVADNDGQLRRASARMGFEVSTETYEPMERLELADDKFKFEGPHEGDWRIMTLEKEARRAQRYSPRSIKRPEPKDK